MKKRALITGINGQDGILLSKFLLKQDYEVFGIGWQKESSIHLSSKIKYFSIDIRDSASLVKLMLNSGISELYNLAGLSSVALSQSEPELTFEINSTAVKQLLDGIADSKLAKSLKMYQASSSEMYGGSTEALVREDSVFNPVSPYGVSKVHALEHCVSFRSKGFYVSSGILFNHESIYRPMKFVTRNVSNQVARLSRGELSQITIGNLESIRDWGYAGDYVEAMWKMLQIDEPQEFVIATGISHSVRDLVSFALSEVGLANEFERLVKVEPSLIRAKDVSGLIGDSRKAYDLLGWRPKWTFEDTIRSMVRYDLSES